VPAIANSEAKAFEFQTNKVEKGSVECLHQHRQVGESATGNFVVMVNARFRAAGKQSTIYLTLVVFIIDFPLRQLMRYMKPPKLRH